MVNRELRAVLVGGALATLLALFAGASALLTTASYAADERYVREKCQERIDWKSLLGRALPETLVRALNRQNVNLLLEIDSAELTKNLLSKHRNEARQWLRERRIGYRSLAIVGNAIEVQIMNPTQLDAIEIIKEPKADEPRMDKRAEGLLVFTLTEGYVRKQSDVAIDDAIKTLGCRLDQITAFSPRRIVREGNERIRVHLNGFQDTEQLRQLITRIGRLSFHQVEPAMTAEKAAQSGYMLLSSSADERKYFVSEKPIVTEEYLADVRVGVDSGSKKPVVMYRFGGTAVRQLGDFTLSNVGRSIAVVLDAQVLSAPTLQAPILAGAGQIDGNFTDELAVQIAVALRSGPLTAKFTILDGK